MGSAVEGRIVAKALVLLAICCSASAVTNAEHPHPEELARKSPVYTAIYSPVVVPFSTRNVTFDQTSHVLVPSQIQITLDSFRIELFQEQLSTGEYDYYYMPVFTPVWSSLKTVFNKLTKRSTVTLDVQVWSANQEEQIQQALTRQVSSSSPPTLKMFPIRHLVFTTSNPDSGINAPSRWIDYSLKPNVLSVSMNCPSRDDLKANEGCQSLLEHLREYPETLIRNMVVDVSLTELLVKDLQRPLYSGYSGVEVEDLNSKVAKQQQLILNLQNQTQDLRNLLQQNSQALPEITPLSIPCGQTLVLSKGQTALLQSPNHPFDYSPGIDCQFTINANGGLVLEFATQYFATEGGCNDGLTIGSNTYCGHAAQQPEKMPPAAFSLTSPSVVRFRTDGSVQHPGFRIAVTVV